MELESILAAAALTAALTPVLAIVCRTWLRAGIAAVVVFAIALPLATTARQFLSRPSAIDPAVLDRPIVAAQDGYVSSSTCRSCHPDEYATWKASYHRTMTQEATPDAVAGRFAGVALRAGDWVYALERRGDEFWATIDKPAGPGRAAVRDQRPVVMTTGSHHYQVYWLPDDKKGALRAFPFVFLLDEQKWIPRKAAFLSPPSSDRTTERARWANGCAKCHSLHSKWRPLRPHTDTRVAELGISCESCHGPGEEHVRLNRDPARRYRAHLGDGPGVAVVQPEDLEPHRSSEVCGQCHGIALFEDQAAFNDWAHNGFEYRPGDDLAETRNMVRGRLEDNTPAMQARLLADKPQFLDDTFWRDGTLRIPGREHTGMLESPCYQRGEISCLSCHVLHKASDDRRPIDEWTNDMLKPGMRGNVACTQCHSAFESDDALTAHTNHAKSSTGSNCYNCHMPYTTFGLLGGVRTHTIDNPSVAVSVETGRPNACNQCHLDRSLGWAAEHLESWYGIPQPILSEDEQNVAAALLWLLRGHAGQRALAAWTMGWDSALEISGGDWMAPYLAQLLVDPYDAVRFVAHRSLRRQPGFAGFMYDSLSSPDERSQVSRLAFDQWSRTASGENRRTAGAILFDAEGRIRRDEVGRLLEQRDDTPTVFRE